MATVNIKEGTTPETIDKYLKIFTRLVDNENILKVIKNRQYYTKPARQRKLDKEKLEKKIKRKLRKQRYDRGV